MEMKPKYPNEQKLYDACKKIRQCGSKQQLESVYNSYRKLIDSSRPGKGTDEQRGMRNEFFSFITSAGGIAYFETHMKISGNENKHPKYYTPNKES